MMRACACLGPDPGHLLCPCREERLGDLGVELFEALNEALPLLIDAPNPVFSKARRALARARGEGPG